MIALTHSLNQNDLERIQFNQLSYNFLVFSASMFWMRILLYCSGRIRPHVLTPCLAYNMGAAGSYSVAIPSFASLNCLFSTLAYIESLISYSFSFSFIYHHLHSFNQHSLVSFLFTHSLGDD